MEEASLTKGLKGNLGDAAWVGNIDGGGGFLLGWSLWPPPFKVIFFFFALGFDGFFLIFFFSEQCYRFENGDDF